MGSRPIVQQIRGNDSRWAFVELLNFRGKSIISAYWSTTGADSPSHFYCRGEDTVWTSSLGYFYHRGELVGNFQRLALSCLQIVGIRWRKFRSSIVTRRERMIRVLGIQGVNFELSKLGARHWELGFLS